MSDVESAAPAAETPISISEAASMLAQQRNKKPAQEAPPETPVEAAPAPELAEEASTAPQEIETSGEVTTESDPAEETLPAIEPPKSWTKEEKAVFAALPREHQQTIAERERERELTIRRGQNEAADKQKAATAAIEAAEQARQKYEKQLSETINADLAAFNATYGDLKTWEDVRKLASTDPVRHGEFQADWQMLQSKTAQAQAAQTRQQEEETKKLQTFIAEENKKFLDKAPEFADPQKAPQLQAEAKELFSDVGLSDEEMQAVWQGQKVSIYDHRVQLIIRDAMRYRAAQKAAKTAPPKPVPPVQRPGTSTGKGEARTALLETLKSKLNRSGSVEDAVALLRAQRRA